MDTSNVTAVMWLLMVSIPRHVRSPAVMTVAVVLVHAAHSQVLSVWMAAAMVTTPAIMPTLGTLSIPARMEGNRAMVLVIMVALLATLSIPARDCNRAIVLVNKAAVLATLSIPARE